VFSKASSSASLKGTYKRDKSSKEGKRRSSRKSDHESSSNNKTTTPSSQWYTTPELELSLPIIPSVATTTVFELRQEVSVCRDLRGSDDGIQHSELLSFWTLSIVWNSEC
jgi:hypothetical protein